MGHLPRDIWPMTPSETDLLIESWNAAQRGGDPPPMTAERFDELKAMYPDG